MTNLNVPSCGVSMDHAPHAFHIIVGAVPWLIVCAGKAKQA